MAQYRAVAVWVDNGDSPSVPVWAACGPPPAADFSAVQRLATQGAKAVRNRCVHYEVRGPARAQLRPGERMHGIVEAVTGRGFDDFNNDVTMATRLVTATLQSWTA